MSPNKIFIVDANRTAVGSLGKSLKNIKAWRKRIKNLSWYENPFGRHTTSDCC